MLNVNFWGKCTKLVSAITSTDTELKLPMGDGTKFPMTSDDHFYLTLKNGGTREVVKVVARRGDVLTVERGQDNTNAQSFGKHACACVEWNPAQLCEYVQSCTQSCTNITPQTFVIDCGTAIEVNACGNIIAVNGSSKC